MNTYKNIGKAVATLKATGLTKIDLSDKKGLRELDLCVKRNISISERGLKAVAVNKDGQEKMYEAVKFSDGSFGVYIYGGNYLVMAWEQVKVIE